MAHDIDIAKLAGLARIEVDPSETEELKKDIVSILGYVEQVQAAQIATVAPQVGDVYNVLRSDTDPHESGLYTETLLEEAPERKGDYIKVKKIL